MQFLALVTDDFCISKNELGVIYDLLVTNSELESDLNEFLSWCKSSCEKQTQTSHILNLAEVGEFIAKKIETGELNVKHLSLVGF